ENRAPYEFTLGSGSVIEGWQLGLGDMCIGEKRKLIIPPALGYGDKGIRATIPPMATLVFETELLAINGNDGRKAEQKEGKKEEL
ncbi:Peptidyl-prolyl cis-trans isomerase fpr2, partial [Tulasnella sp. 427]